MKEAPFSWVHALDEGSLSELQLEALQAAVDSGQAESLLEAAQQLDFEATHRVGEEPGSLAY
jgi:hypothetical protein